jgi:hypothetical protein
MPEILHTQTGLEIRRNDKNRFCVIRLHYTADPTKRSDAWKTEARSGMSKAKWDREYEIDYTALFGQKVFPQIIDREDEIVVKAKDFPTFPPGQQFWGGFDYGILNPSSFHVYTIHEGVTYSVWELFEQCRNLPEFVAKMKLCPYWGMIKVIAGDVTLWSTTQQTKIGAVSVHQLFADEGVHNMVKGSQDDTAWLQMMGKHWGRESVTFKIFENCQNQIREFKTAIYVSMSERMALTHNYKEQVVDRDNHSLDDCKYFMLMGVAQQRKDLKLPIMVRRWMN